MVRLSAIRANASVESMTPEDSGLTAGGRSGGVVKQTHLNLDGGPLQNAKGRR
jgi:hypothetical protein